MKRYGDPTEMVSGHVVCAIHCSTDFLMLFKIVHQSSTAFIRKLKPISNLRNKLKQQSEAGKGEKLKKVTA